MSIFRNTQKRMGEFILALFTILMGVWLLFPMASMATAAVEYWHPMLQGLALVKASGDQIAASALLDQIFGINA